ncbi:MAG: hypothetical protein ACLTSG_00010 [Lachnospiraceae bacterium]
MDTISDGWTWNFFVPEGGEHPCFLALHAAWDERASTRQPRHAPWHEQYIPYGTGRPGLGDILRRRRCDTDHRMKDGFIKAAAAAPELRVADPKYNTEKIVECIEEAKAAGVKVLIVLLPEAGPDRRDLRPPPPPALSAAVTLALEGLRGVAAATAEGDMLWSSSACHHAARTGRCRDLGGQSREPGRGHRRFHGAEQNVRGTPFASLAAREIARYQPPRDFEDYCRRLGARDAFLRGLDGSSTRAVGVQFAADRRLPCCRSAVANVSRGRRGESASSRIESMSVRSAFPGSRGGRLKTRLSVLHCGHGLRRARLRREHDGQELFRPLPRRGRRRDPRRVRAGLRHGRERDRADPEPQRARLREATFASAARRAPVATPTQGLESAGTKNHPAG